METKGDTLLKICGALAVVWVACFLTSVLQPGTSIAKIVGGLQMLVLAAFVVVHGAASNGWRGIGIYLVLGIVVAFVYEALSIAYGFPFGLYTHNVPGPKPLGVPLHVPPSYAFLGWFAWSLARSIVRNHPNDAGGFNRFTTPIIAALILTGFDYAYDSIGSTVLNMWTWAHPSGVFGVPLSNYLGWTLTGWTFFQIFALVEHRFAPSPVTHKPMFWLLPGFIWLVYTIQYPAMFGRAPSGTARLATVLFVIADVYEAALVASLFSIAFPALLALFKVVTAKSQHSQQQHPLKETSMNRDALLPVVAGTFLLLSPMAAWSQQPQAKAQASHVLFNKVTVSDLAKSYEFYTKVIGMKAVAMPGAGDPKPPGPPSPSDPPFMELAFNFSGSPDDPFFVLIAQKGSKPNPDSARLTWTGFKVPDVKAAADRVKQAGYEVTVDKILVPGTMDRYVALVRDPDGYTIEFLQTP